MEPIFRHIRKSDEEIEKAHRQCSDTINRFIEMVKIGGEPTYMAKLSFRDPDKSEQEGMDHIFYLWLSDVLYHPDTNLLSGIFFEIPDGFERWHQIGQRLGFDPEDVFDWMVIDKGHAKGAYTLRVSRERLATEQERKDFDLYIGVASYE
ncbi:DUF2314 domain-containing protein [Pseudomonas sp. EA_35y_Pfl2_R5]|uniref:DUF2314 domain-containing protein n=1 Tax=Pseudomonas sp. EA_35y_Pfl2_R5 TaxID=3088690 RepID=UPI0030D87879